MILAPHPDDDVLAAAGVLQWAAAAGGCLRVVYLTDGENNPWAQRRIEHRLRIRAADRRRWGARRRHEALESLARLGVDRGAATFLGLPDQGLTDVLLAAPEELVGPLAREISGWRPTLLLVPSMRDRHPDHGAAALAARAAMARLPARQHPPVLAYGIHGTGPGPGGAGVWTLALDAGQRAAKREALLAHASQLVWHRRTLLAAAAPDERFTDELALADADTVPTPGCTLRGEPGGWTFEFQPDWRDALGGRELLVAALVHGVLALARVPFPARAPHSLGIGNGRPVSGTLVTGWCGTRLRASLTGPPPAATTHWFVKVGLTRERRLGCMDRWPWLGASVPAGLTDEIPHAAVASAAGATAPSSLVETTGARGHA